MRYAAKSDLFALGQKRSKNFEYKAAKIKAVTPTTFKRDISTASVTIAEEFLKHLGNKLRFLLVPKEMEKIQEMFMLDKPVKAEDLMLHLVVDKKGVIHVDKDKLKNVPWEEIWIVIERGRKDLGILPQDIIGKQFRDYRAKHKRAIKKRLENKVV